ncbi:MAG: ABC transporter permease [Bacillota bacterium]
MAAFLMTVYVLWLRELKRFLREKTRILTMFGQPLLYLLVMGQGLRATFRIDIEGFDYLSFIYPGVIGMSVLFTAMFSSVSIIWDREFGFLKEVLVAPVPRSAIAVGKALGGSTTAVLQGTILLILAPVAGLHIHAAQIALLLPLMFLLAFAITSFGTLVAARTETMEGFHMIMNFLIMPLFMLSGAFFPVSSAPAWMQPLMKMDPVAYGVDAFRNVLYTGAGTAAKNFAVAFPLGLDVAVLLGFAALMVALGMLAFTRTE